MKTFNEWLQHLKNKEFFERLEIKTTSVPDITDPVAKVWGFKLSDKQSVDSWKKKNTSKTYSFPLEKDRFIHFAPLSVVSVIIKEQVLRGYNGSTFGISASFGQYVPRVQYRTKGKGRAGNPRGFSEEIGAIIFKTNVFPIIAKSDEVIWSGNSVKIKEATEISTRLAITMLKNTTYGKTLNWNDVVEYY